MQLLKESPERYYEAVKTERPEDAREEGAITLSTLNNTMSRQEALLALSIAILELKEWFNVKGNMTDRQVKMTAELILDYPAFFDLSIGNIKSCFREKMMTEKLYDRLDGNIIIGWLRKFKSDMADACYNQRREQDRITVLKEEGEWKGLDGKIDDNGVLNDEAAPRRKLDLLSNLPNKKRIRTKEEEEEWKRKFNNYKAEYLLKKKNGERIL